MAKSTTNYEMFKFREDNREKGVNQYNLKDLIEKIRKRNLLPMCPIIVNGAYEVMNGQHRLLAAKFLGLPIYYEVQEDLDFKDMIAMNSGKNWLDSDVLNAFCKNGYDEYIKLKKFMTKHDLSITIAKTLIVGKGRDQGRNFRDGKFIFDEEEFGQAFEICHDTIAIIRKINGSIESSFTRSSRFWRPLISLIRHDDFDSTHWFKNISKHTSLFTAKASSKEYSRINQKIYNYHARIKIYLDEVESFDSITS